MLTLPHTTGRSIRPPFSLRQEYEEFILQRIEEFKSQLTRGQLFAIADEAVGELEAGPEGQLLLTEVLVLEHVDQLIVRRLNLPRYRRWRDRFVRLRRAQREPAHWGLDPDTPLAGLASRLEEDDVALVLGGRAAATAFFLAAHDASVLLIDQELAAVEAAEATAVGEGLGSRLKALVVQLGPWFPDVTPALVVLDAGALDALDAATRAKVIAILQHRTPTGGVHCLLPPDPRGTMPALAPEALHGLYTGWLVERARRGDNRSTWFTAVKP